jgi:hypothetical protein
MTEAQIDQLLVLDSEPGPAQPLSAADADLLIDAALLGAGFAPAGGPGPSGGGASAAGRGIGGFKLAAAAIAIAVVVVVIAILVGRHGRAHEVVVPPDAPPDAAIASGSGISIDAAPAPEPAAPPPEPAPADEPAPPHKAEPAHKSAAAESRAINDLLGEANAKRAAHEWRESDALYARVVKRAPGTLGAQTALVASGSLHLEHLGDPRGAAVRFKRALAIAPDAAMAEEARWGLAEAARARGDAAGEAKALDDFLAHHPDSPLAPKARARRQELK